MCKYTSSLVFEEVWVCVFPWNWAGSENVCVRMDRSERSYELLGEYASGKRVYDLELCSDASVYIVFCPQGSNGSSEAPRVKLPKLKATMEHLVPYQYKWTSFQDTFHRSNHMQMFSVLKWK